MPPCDPMKTIMLFSTKRGDLQHIDSTYNFNKEVPDSLVAYEIPSPLPKYREGQQHNYTHHHYHNRNSFRRHSDEGKGDNNHPTTAYKNGGYNHSRGSMYHQSASSSSLCSPSSSSFVIVYVTTSRKRKKSRHRRHSRSSSSSHRIFLRPIALPVLMPAEPRSRLRDLHRSIRAYVRRVGSHLSDATVDKICDCDYDVYSITIPLHGSTNLKGIPVPRYDLRDSDYILEAGKGSCSTDKSRNRKLNAIVVDLPLKYSSEYKPERERFEQRQKSVKRKQAKMVAVAKDKENGATVSATAMNSTNGDFKKHDNGATRKNRNGGDGWRGNGGVSIYDCLDLFVKPER